MTRKEFIDRIIAIYRLKYKPSDLEVDEFRLALELMPNTEPLTITTPSQSPIIINPNDNQTFPWNNPWSVVMYGCQMPEYNSTSTGTNTSDLLKENKSE